MESQSSGERVRDVSPRSLLPMETHFLREGVHQRHGGEGNYEALVAAGSPVFPTRVLGLTSGTSQGDSEARPGPSVGAHSLAFHLGLVTGRSPWLAEPPSFALGTQNQELCSPPGSHCTLSGIQDEKQPKAQ